MKNNIKEIYPQNQYLFINFNFLRKKNNATLNFELTSNKQFFVEV